MMVLLDAVARRLPGALRRARRARELAELDGGLGIRTSPGQRTTGAGRCPTCSSPVTMPVHRWRREQSRARASCEWRRRAQAAARAEPRAEGESEPVVASALPPPRARDGRRDSGAGWRTQQPALRRRPRRVADDTGGDPAPTGATRSPKTSSHRSLRRRPTAIREPRRLADGSSPRPSPGDRRLPRHDHRRRRDRAAREGLRGEPLSDPVSSMEPTLHCAQPASGCEARFSDRAREPVHLPPTRPAPRRDRRVRQRRRSAGQVRCRRNVRQRLIGLPGETVEVRLRRGEGYVFVNGKELDEPDRRPAPLDRGVRAGEGAAERVLHDGRQPLPVVRLARVGARFPGRTSSARSSRPTGRPIESRAIAAHPLRPLRG